MITITVYDHNKQPVQGYNFAIKDRSEAFKRFQKLYYEETGRLCSL
jgi:hypothetical protein